MRKLSNKEALDISSMMYWIPQAAKRRITQADKVKMAELSGSGKHPQRETLGFKALSLGRTYRDEQITSYMRDVRLGYFTKHELISSMPTRLQPWLTKKLKKVPYDEAAYENVGTEDEPDFQPTGKGTSAILATLYRNGASL